VHNTEEAKARRGDSWDRRGYVDPDPWDYYLSGLVSILDYKLPKQEESTVLCPECGKEIDDKLVHSHVARLMGKKGGVIGGSSKSEKKRKSSARNLEQWRKRQEEKK